VSFRLQATRMSQFRIHLSRVPLKRRRKATGRSIYSCVACALPHPRWMRGTLYINLTVVHLQRHQFARTTSSFLLQSCISPIYFHSHLIFQVNHSISGPIHNLFTLIQVCLFPYLFTFIHHIYLFKFLSFSILLKHFLVSFLFYFSNFFFIIPLFMLLNKFIY
jgi:hypothetical protein